MNISIIGAGNMGSSIARALAKKDYKVSIYDIVREKALKTQEGSGNIAVLKSISDASGSDAVLLAVKPQVLPGLYKELRGVETGFWISIAAGVPLSVLEDHLGNDKVIRFMPNIAAAYGKAVTAIAAGSGVSAEARESALSIASTFGSAYVLPESQFSAFTAVSGSGIAYMLDFLHGLAMGGVNEGLPYAEALNIVRDTLESAVALQKETGKNPVELETMVCSAGGTTIAGMKALEDNGFASALYAAVHAASKRSQELEAAAAR